ncbi:hypothetical protein CULT_150055 [[Clostridium] ultunense Esp]|nr:hypothetical protein CULT_150055 [[Clostridium] ultunense Esp]
MGFLARLGASFKRTGVFFRDSWQELKKSTLALSQRDGKLHHCGPRNRHDGGDLFLYPRYHFQYRGEMDYRLRNRRKREREIHRDGKALVCGAYLFRI